MRIIQTANYEQMSQTAAILILNEVLEKNHLVLGLATGHTPSGLYRALVNARAELGLDPVRLSCFHLDEYLGLTPHDQESMAHYLVEHLLDPMGIPHGQRHFVPAADQAPEQACALYEQEIAEAGGIDLQILGIGSNGHIAFNEPGTPFELTTHVANLSAETRETNARYFASGQTPAQAMTMGPRSIMQARQVILLASGAGKADAIAAMLNGPLSEDCPASLLRLHPHLTLVLDHEAAAGLSFPLPGFQPLGLEVYPSAFNLPNSCERVLVAAPHPDDASISCGGTLARLQKAGSRLHLVSMSSGHRADIPNTTQAMRVQIREAEGLLEAQRLNAAFTPLNLPFYEKGYMPGSEDISRFLALLEDFQPTAVFSTSPQDRHPAHRASALIVQEAVHQYVVRHQRPLEIWFYEGPWYVFERDDFNTVVELQPDELTLKMLGVLSHQSQVQRKRYDLAAEALARFRAITVPESRLASFGGGQATELGDHLELFQRVSWQAQGQQVSPVKK